MHVLAPLTALALLQAPNEPDVYLLPIGPPGQVTVAQGYTDLRSGRTARVGDVAAAADGHRFVLLGESHDNPHHHEMQAQVIGALVARGRDVVVGLEMFTRPMQSALAPWTLGWWDEATFMERSEWRTQWGFDFALYRPVFEAVREHRLPMLALNVPRDWVRAVGRGGPDALTPAQRAELPPLYLDNAEHRRVFEALIGGHPVAGDRGRNMYAAQVLWDEGMADTALRYFARRAEGPSTVMVILAGSGHAKYKQGIDWRLTRRTGEPVLTLIGLESAEPRQVSRGLGDFAYVSPPVQRAPR